MGKSFTFLPFSVLLTVPGHKTPLTWPSNCESFPVNYILILHTAKVFHLELRIFNICYEHAYIHTYIHTYIHSYIHVYILHIPMYIYANVHVFANVHIQIHTYVWINNAYNHAYILSRVYNMYINILLFGL